MCAKRKLWYCLRMGSHRVNIVINYCYQVYEPGAVIAQEASAWATLPELFSQQDYRVAFEVECNVAFPLDGTMMSFCCTVITDPVDADKETADQTLEDAADRAMDLLEPALLAVGLRHAQIDGAYECAAYRNLTDMQPLG